MTPRAVNTVVVSAPLYCYKEHQDGKSKEDHQKYLWWAAAGYADELFNVLLRLGPSRMFEEGFDYGEAGDRAFTEEYGLVEKIPVIEPADGACSERQVTTRVRHKP